MLSILHVGSAMHRIFSLAFVTALIAACASNRGVSISDREKYAVYDRIVISGAAGQTVAYFYRPQGEIRQFVIVVQTDPCESSYNEQNAPTRIGTGGVLWHAFREDSAFLMLEKPYILREELDKAEEKRVVPESDRDCSLERWQLAIREVVAAVRRSEKLGDVPALYVGLADGAVVGTALALTDNHSVGLVLIGASGLGKRFDLLTLALRDSPVTTEAGIATVQDANEVANEIQTGVQNGKTEQLWGRPVLRWRPFLDSKLSHSLRQHPELPVLLVHGTADPRFPVEGALGLYAELAAVRQRVSFLLLDGLGHDLGVSEQKADCFAVASSKIAEWVREWKSDTNSITRIAREQCPDS